MQGQVLGCKSLIKVQWYLQRPSRALGHVSDPMLWVHDEGGYEKRGRKHYDEDQAPKISSRLRQRQLRRQRHRSKQNEMQKKKTNKKEDKKSRIVHKQLRLKQSLVVSD